MSGTAAHLRGKVKEAFGAYQVAVEAEGAIAEERAVAVWAKLRSQKFVPGENDRPPAGAGFSTPKAPAAPPFQGQGTPSYSAATRSSAGAAGPSPGSVTKKTPGKPGGRGGKQGRGGQQSKGEQKWQKIFEQSKQAFRALHTDESAPPGMNLEDKLLSCFKLPEARDRTGAPLPGGGWLALVCLDVVHAPPPACVSRPDLVWPASWSRRWMAC